MDLLLSACYGEDRGGVSSSSSSSPSIQDQYRGFISEDRKLEQASNEPSSSSSPRYSCQFCDYKTDKKSNHDNHTKFVHFKARDSCPECGKQIANLNQHLRAAHKIFKSSESEKMCPMCDKQFINLGSHMQKAHDVKLQAEYICEVCFKSFDKKDHWIRHERVHVDTKLKCQICNKEVSNLPKHLKTKHALDESGFSSVLFLCDFCNQTFNKKSELNQHKEINHAVANPEKKYCDICCKHFANLAQHQKIVHSGVKNFKCQNCQKGFYDNRELRRHHIKFLKNKECKKEVTDVVCKYNCDFVNCDYKSNKKGNMEMHRESVHLNIKYNCPECNKVLSSRANLNSHVKNVHDKKIVNGSLQKDPFKLKFRCKLCDYTTNRSMHLDRHMLSVHSVAAFETVEQVYQASQASEREQEQEQDPGSRVSVPQFASLVQVEGGGQYLVPEPGQDPRVPGGGDLLGLAEDQAFQLVDNLPSIYFV